MRCPKRSPGDRDGIFGTASGKSAVENLVGLRVRDVCQGDRVSQRAIVMQRKTRRPVQFEITPTTREALDAWIKAERLKGDNFLFPSRVRAGDHQGTRQYARIAYYWMDEIVLDAAAYGRHSIRRTKPSPIYRRTKNLRAVQ